MTNPLLQDTPLTDFAVVRPEHVTPAIDAPYGRGFMSPSSLPALHALIDAARSLPGEREPVRVPLPA